jgi:hypothetical protein
LKKNSHGPSTAGFTDHEFSPIPASTALAAYRRCFIPRSASARQAAMSCLVSGSTPTAIRYRFFGSVVLVSQQESAIGLISGCCTSIFQSPGRVGRTRSQTFPVG